MSSNRVTALIADDLLRNAVSRSRVVKLDSNGFALVVALLLMGFVLVLILALSTILEVEQNAAAIQKNRVEARLNAMLGLSQAVGQLQRLAGPDQRVTARADILSDSVPSGKLPNGNAYWTGVWDNRESAGIARPDNMLNYGSQRAASDGRLPGFGADTTNPNRPKWLISIPEGLDLDPRLALVGQSGTNGTVALVAETDNGAGDAVEAVLIPIGDAGNIHGNFAWWVGDEGVKSNFALASDHANSWTVPRGNNNNYFMQQLYASEQKYSALDLWDDLEWYEPIDFDDAMKIQNFSELGVLFSEPIDDLLRRNFHNLTSYSKGLLTDVQNGGLKIDLSRALEEQWPDFLIHLAKQQGRTLGAGVVQTVTADGIAWAEPAPLFAVPFPTGYAPANPEPQVEDGDRIYGPLWDVLYSHYHAYKPLPPYSPWLKNPPGGGSNDWGNEDNFFEWKYIGYSGKTLPETEDWLDVGTLLHPLEDDAIYGPPGLKSADTLSPEIHPVSQGSALSGGMIPLDGDYFGYTPDYQIGENIRELVKTGQTSMSRGEPVWDAKVPTVVMAGMRLALSTTLEEPNKLDPNLSATPADPDDDIYVLHLHIYPYFVLWNPYNVALRERQYEVTGDYKIPMQIYYDKNGSGTTERNQLLLRNYASDSGPDTWTASGGVYERDAHDHGVFLHRLISMNAIQGMNVSSRPTPSQGARFRRAQSLVLTSEPLELGPGEYAILTSKFFADVTADGYGNEYMSFDYTNPTKVSDPSMNNSNFDTGRGFIVDLLAVSDWKNPSPSAPNRTAAQWHIVEPIPVNTPGRLVVRFYNESYGESGAKAAYAGQGKFLLGLSRGDRMVEVGSGSNDVIFMDPAVSIDESDLQVDLGDPLLLLNNPADFAWFGWRNEETEGGSKPLYSVLNPRLMANTNFLGLNLSRTQAVLAETFYELGGSYEPQVGAGPDGRKLVHAGGSYDASGQTSLVLYDVPRQPARSIADFMHANISFFDVMPSYAIGNSFASPYFDTSEYAAAIDNKKLGRDVLLPDLSYLSNDALFDEYFLSTIPVDLSSAPVVGYSKYTQSFFDSLPPYEKVDAGFIESGKLLPNSRLLFMRDGSESPLAYLDELRDFRTAGSKLILDGAFNVNSTSVAAWTGFLGGVKALSDLGYYETATGSEGTLSSSALAYSFMRFATPSGKENDEWRGFRALSGDEIVELAENIVSEVKARGPFLSMADFVNRRLTRGSTGEKGALQAAIDASSINSSFGGSSSLAGAVGTYVPPAPKAGLPGFLLQNDVLRVLGPQMAVRSDTFKVRAYGESRNAVTGLVEGRAMCEAVVQRVPEWVDPINASEDDIYVDAPNGDYDSALSAINQSFGRRFKLISFRWMNDQEMP